MSRLSRAASCMLAAWLVVTTVGCATLNLSKIDFRSRKATARNPAVKVVCLWEPAEGRDPKGRPCQGFAGQIIFMNESNLPVSVEGDVRIYLFDDAGTAEESIEPLHKFDFDSPSWNRHYVWGTLGPSYNVFVPYMRRGVHQANCALRLRLTPEGGFPLFSEMTSIEMLGFGGQRSQGTHSTSQTKSDRRVEQTTPEDVAAMDSRRHTTTIMLNSREGVIDSTGKNVLDGTIQQAGYQADNVPKPLTAADVRVAELEKMVRELRAMSTAQQTSAQQQAAAAAPPRQLPEEDLSRIRVRSATTDNKPSIAKPKAPVDDSSAAVRSSRHPLAAEALGSRHPLDDEGDAAPVARSTRIRQHPLSDSDDQPIEATSVKSRRQTPRHPLANLDDDDDRPAPRRKPVATQTPAESRNKSIDPFDPIETESIETTAVQESPGVRQKMRVARQ